MCVTCNPLFIIYGMVHIVTYGILWYVVCIVPVRGVGAEKAGKIAPKFLSLEQF